MSKFDEAVQIPVECPVQTIAGLGTGDSFRQTLDGNTDPRVPLLKLSNVRVRMDSLQRFLTESVNHNTLLSKDQMGVVSSEIVAAIHQIIVNGAALLAYSQQPPAAAVKTFDLMVPKALTSSTVDDEKVSDQNRCIAGKAPNPTDPKAVAILDPKVEAENEETKDEIDGSEDDCEIIELDAVELLAEHVHFCEICGKGFKRDANLRMHMRAHGNQFKTPEALARPEKASEPRRKTRFSCPFQGCNRNKEHRKFKALKSVICVKNHFKRSHCPKMYSCNRCNKKSFSVLADLKSHLKHCGEAKWKCSCGTTFSRKDKLFGHMALFEGHMPAVVADDEKLKGVATMEEDEDEDRAANREELGANFAENGLFEGLLDGFGAMEDYCFQDMLGSPTGLNVGMNGFFGL